MKLLLTGANGFVGRSAWRRFNAMDGVQVVGAARRVIDMDMAASVVGIDDLSGQTDWSAALNGVNAVVHTAARVHMMNDAADDPLMEFRRVNVQGTLHLARQAAAVGVKRFVFLSSVKVNGEETFTLNTEGKGGPFRADDVPAPRDSYGISKMEAEMGLLEIAARTGMEVVIVRPPLVYGPGVKANFATMMRWLARGMPLPLGAVTHNRRSLVALDNLVDFIVTCLTHPAAANQIFLVSDGEDLSTTDLLRRMGLALGKPARLVPVPPSLLKIGAFMVGVPELAQRLCGSLQVDISKARRLLEWEPPVSVDEGLWRTAEEYWHETHI